MKVVAKYNTCKAISTVLTVVTPIVTLMSCSDLFVHRSDSSVSAAGMFAIFLSLLFFKDKIAENFKVPYSLSHQHKGFCPFHACCHTTCL